MTAHGFKGQNQVLANNVNRLIADLRNNAKATTISRKAGGMPKPQE